MITKQKKLLAKLRTTIRNIFTKHSFISDIWNSRTGLFCSYVEKLNNFGCKINNFNYNLRLDILPDTGSVSQVNFDSFNSQISFFFNAKQSTLRILLVKLSIYAEFWRIPMIKTPWNLSVIYRRQRIHF